MTYDQDLSTGDCNRPLLYLFLDRVNMVFTS
jgi:hypothetical protein